MHHTILLVEDDPNDVLLIQRAFQQNGDSLNLIVLSDGEAALKYLEKARQEDHTEEYPIPQLVMLDLKLPRISGFEVLEWIRNHPRYRHLPVVVFSSSSMQEDVNMAYDLGVNSYLLKPVDYDQMIRVANLICEYWLKLNISPLPTLT